MTETQIAARSRTYSWTDPQLNLAEFGRRSGLDLFRAMAAGDIPAPPIMHTMGIERLDVEEGRITVVMPVREFHYNPLGTVHGGVIATLLDTAAACSVHSTLPAGMAYTSLDLTTKFVRPVTLESGLLRCDGSVIQRGRRTALAQAQLHDQAGRLVAHATSSCLILGLNQ